MNLSRVLVPVLVRSSVVVGVSTLVLLLLLDGAESDALGAGLLTFFVVMTIAGIWSLVDGVRHGLTPGVLVWPLVAILSGVGVPAAIALVWQEASVATKISEGFVFFALLMILPSIFGLGFGALVHRLRGGADAASA